ncbi:DUF1858 domain-containing protein, partial [Candidatus Woesearchaeota archaeon]|nr:DUF1858 domain-containing protein [Candidatus Woesearchaeota archaeon]
MVKSTLKKERITKNTLIVDALQQCPEAMGIMFEHGLHCVGCHGGTFETIEQGCKVHGMSDTEIEEMVEKVNEAIVQNKKSKLA